MVGWLLLRPPIREGKQTFSGVMFINALIPSMGFLPSMSSYSPKKPPLNIIVLGGFERV